MRHLKAEEWERRLKAVFDRIDDRMEALYGERYALHPARMPHGATGNRESDGLFNIGAAFSAGIGSEHGPGYVIELRWVTLAPVADALRLSVEADAIRLLSEELPGAFPGKDLRVVRDGPTHKIVGDLTLDAP